MADLDDARALALGLPETTEQDHHGMASFRVRGKIFATVPDDAHLRVMLGEPAIHAAIAEYPDACEPFYWGKRLACAVVSLADVDRTMLGELVTDAWLAKAPARLAQQLDSADD
ncbi:MmcQ/YjbR family DNA-binding protein [uncultured Jatrophihabitans sp.]|uniref:MmcQ/YjbR family DNA-binding protein n=1 Tax=uncultured Jatrophihabitans sp. TaxID=1610747 RepID=UPI0035CBDCBB